MERPHRAAGQGNVQPASRTTSRASWTRHSRVAVGSPPRQVARHDRAGFYETALRVIGAYIDQQQPRDVFFFEQDHQFVMRLLMPTRAGLRHVLVEFTREEIEAMIASARPARARRPDVEPVAMRLVAPERALIVDSPVIASI